MGVVLTLVIVVAMLASLTLALVNRRRNALLSAVPGPLVFVPFFGNMLEMLIRFVWTGGDLIEASEQTRKKYGPIYVVWTGHLPYVVIGSAEDAEVVLTHEAVADKGLGYELVAPWLGDGLLLAGGKKWHGRRKAIAPTFSVQVLEQFSTVFDKHAAILEDKLRQRVGQGAFDVVPLMTLCTLDVISETAMGVQLNAQTQGDSVYAKAVKTACLCFFTRQVYPWLRSEPLLRLSSVGKQFSDAIGVLHGLTHRVIDQRRKEISAKVDEFDSAEQDDVGVKKKAVLLDHLLTKSLRGEAISDQDITDEVNTFLFAGHDTTMTSLCFTLHLLSTHPDVQDAVHSEVRDAVLPRDLAELKYLERVVRESLRLYPSVPLIVRDCKREFTLPSGYRIPVGTQVGVDLISLHRDARVFPKPREFDPDRFLPDRVQGRHHFAHIPFSAAQRNCIGQRFAMMEMKTILARLVRSFRILPPSDSYKLNVQYQVVLMAKDGVLIQLEQRN